MNIMFTQLFVLVFVTCASGFSLWDTLSSIFSGVKDLTPSVGPEDAFLNIVQLANKYGYPIETHSVITEDGYILKMHRIPHGTNVTSNGKVIFLMHGIWESSDSWLLLGPDKALAYMLADQGYDVWMGNARGNKYTFLHKTLNANMAKFWNYTWEEIGLYDLPTMIDYALEFTGEKRLYYVGFSQGTTSFFVMNSMRPEYNKKIVRMFALAPEVFMGNARHILLKIFSPATSYLQNFLFNFNIFSSGTDFLNRITPFLCTFVPVRCDNFFFSVVGPNNVNESMWPVILGHMPTGSSTLQFLHYGQLANSKRFCRYDFDKVKNLERYGQTTPPDYNLSAVTTPVVLFCSGNDWFSDRRDIELLKSKVPLVTGEYYIKQFSHVDFMYADEASTLVYSNIIKEIKSPALNRITPKPVIKQRNSPYNKLNFVIKTFLSRS